MAEAFVNKIEDFLACSICFEQLKDPVGLPCLHGFCFECLQDWYRASQDKSQVVCPECRKSTPVPENGIRGFPGHFLVNNLKETVDKQKQVSTTSSAACDLCTEPADNHCLDCKQYLCKQCHKQHNAFKLMKDHKVVSAKDILSGKISSQGRHCLVHGEMIQFYCNSEDKQVCQYCITLKTCAIWHDRVPLSEAAKKQFGTLKQLVSAVEGKKEAYRSHLSKTEQIRTSLDTSFKKINEDLENVITETTENLQELLQKKRVILTEEYSIKDKQVNDAQDELKSKLSSSVKACSLAEHVINHGSVHDITFKYSTLKTTMEGITSSKDKYNISESLGTFSFEPGKPEDYIKLKPDSPACMESKHEYLFDPENTWTISKNVSTNGSDSVRDIAILSDGDMVIASEKHGAKIYSAMGTYECTLQCTPKQLQAIAVTPDGRIITIGNAKLLCYNIDGKQLSPITTMAPPIAVAVDKNGRIIAGLNNRIIIIHYSDGSQISGFRISSSVQYISTTSQNNMVLTLLNDLKTGKLLVVTYDGMVITEIDPPIKGIEWDPGFTCCNSKDEIFVINEAWSNCGVFWYTHEGQYLGCVTSDVNCPRGLSVSSDDQLIVAQENGKVQYYDRLQGTENSPDRCTEK